jgi:hypothetical protein
MDTPEEVVDQAQPEEDYEAFEARMNANDSGLTQAPGYTTPTPAASVKTAPPSVPAEAPPVDAEAGQTAEASEAADPNLEQEVAEVEEVEEEDEPEKDTRLARRMRKLTGALSGATGEIAELRSRLEAYESPTDEEIPGEVASPPAAVAAVETRPPELEDFEDTDTETAWKQFRKADLAYHKAETARLLDAYKAEQVQKQQENEVLAAKTAADRAWSEAASRFSDFNEVVARPEVQISGAMEAVLRMDPVAGTALAHYLGNHPEESLAIAKETLASNPQQWSAALVRAGIKLNAIQEKLKTPGETSPVKVIPPSAPKPAAAPVKPAIAPVPPLQPKKITTAHKPPLQIRSAGVAPKLDTSSDEGAADYEAWEKARELEVAVTNGRR